MKIERIRIIGFKTFADETILNFHPGITCIVGPNGCGKSNVVDAFKWAIGEQSAKTLRSSIMEDLIFNGTTSRTQKGMASVTIYLSETGVPAQIGQPSSGENINTTVSRKLNRFGESEYLINNQKTRLKDVRDLFLDTGLEVGSYSILEQGKISEVILAKPIDRRYLIEEAAGVMKYKVRKTEATSKLERAKINLDRITDITNEVKRSIATLDRQVKKAENYKNLSTRLGEIELKAARHDFLEHQIVIRNYTLEKTLTINTTETLNLKYIQLEDKKKAINNSIALKEGIIESKNETFHNLLRELALIEKDSAIKEAELNNININIKRYSLQKGEYSLEITEDSENIKKLSETIETIEGEKQLLDVELEILNSRTGLISEGLTSKELILKDTHRSLFKVTEHINRVSNEILRIQHAASSLKQKHISGTSFTEKSSAEIDQYDKKIVLLQQSMKASLEIIFALKQELISIKEQISKHQVKIDKLWRSISNLREDLASNNSRLSSLEGFTSSELNLDALSQHIDIPISEIINVEPEYETAVENALSERIKGFVLKDRESLKRAVKFVKDQAIARTVFISKEFSHNCQDIPELKALYKLVKTSLQYSLLIESLLADFFIVSDIDAALDYQKKYIGQKTIRFVTMDGDIIEHSGAVITGRQSSLLKHLREIKTLKESIPKINLRIEKEQGDVKNLTSEMDRLRETLKECEAKILKSERESSNNKYEMERHNDEKERILKRIRHLKLESDQVNIEINVLVSDLAQKESQLSSLTIEKQTIDRDITEIIDNMSGAKAEIESIRSSFTEKKLSFERKKERLKGIQNERAQFEKKIYTSKSKIDSIDKEILTLTESDKIIKAEIKICSQNILELKGKEQAIKDSIAADREALNLEIESLEKNEKGLNPLRLELDELKDKVRGIEVTLTEHRLRAEGIAENISNIYGMDIATIETEPLLEDERMQMPILRQKIQSLGPVNLASIEEHQELSKRFEFLTTQRDDISKSIIELEETIDKINSTTKIRLKDAFNKLNVSFNDTFKSLFGGGRAEIRLTDNNILEAGLEIVVQPPGKKLQDLNLLSGGEKTLSALSLVFAGFLVKPTPLCILDEADAALDETNSARFSNMIKTLSSNTQFIIITHNRQAMEAADYIYGITSEEAGVSRILSMQMVES